MARSQHSRRDFLRGKAAAGALRESVEGAYHFPTEDPTERNYLVSLSRRAMACDFEIQFPADREQNTTEHAVAALDLIERLEDQMTVYRDDSEVIRINQSAADGPVEVESRLFGVLQLASRLYQETGGAFDLTSGPLSQVWGFSRREGRVPSEEEIESALQCVGFDKVLLDDAASTIAFSKPEVEINLNSIGKGYALDRSGELLLENGVDESLFHGGKSSVLAWGKETEGWKIGLRHPLRPAERLTEFTLRGQALATSGSGTQFFDHQGKRYGHILDPRTGWPVEGVLSATVIAPTAAEADALSTAFYVMGPKAVERYCATRPSIHALLVCPDKREDEVLLHAFNLDDAKTTAS